jgi:hypothetical protein
MPDRPRAGHRCFCTFLHARCDTQRCPQARFCHTNHSYKDKAQQHEHEQELPEGDGFDGTKPVTESLRNLRQSAQVCSTCEIIVSAVLEPHVQEEWEASIGPAWSKNRDHFYDNLLEDPEEIRIELEPAKIYELSGRVFFRTRASLNASDWRHFNLWAHEPQGEHLSGLLFKLTNL